MFGCRRLQSARKKTWFPGPRGANDRLFVPGFDIRLCLDAVARDPFGKKRCFWNFKSQGLILKEPLNLFCRILMCGLHAGANRAAKNCIFCVIQPTS